MTDPVSAHILGRMNALRGRARPRALLLLGLIVSGLFAWLAVRNTNVDAVWTAFRDTNLWWTGPSLALLAVAMFFRAVRWRCLFRATSRPSLGVVTGALLLGTFFNSVLPLRAGEAARVVALKRWAGVSQAETAATVVIERLYDVLSLLVLLFVALPWLPSVGWTRPAAGAAVVLALAIATTTLVLIVYGDRPLRSLLRPLARMPLLSSKRVDDAATNLHYGLEALRSWRVAAASAFWTLCSWVAMALSYWMLMLGFHLDLPPLAGMLVVIAVGLALILPASAAAVGTFEVATLAALDAYGIPRSQALSYALVLHTLNFLPYVAVGLVVLRHFGGRTAASSARSDGPQEVSTSPRGGSATTRP